MPPLFLTQEPASFSVNVGLLFQAMQRFCAQAEDMKAGAAAGAWAVLVAAAAGAAAIAIVDPAKPSPKMAAVIIFLNIDLSSILLSRRSK
ncbi:conserved protein of unknown function [Acidithiobacillus ferrivorans]|uniref:Uncharacterized protein n=1 Tax=Acidithiobacillus ferrivorans TaxID=160808 RepID=A0A060US09_9PROT|nr:conserved hypothetical protein [Acidithiobacillus ferrivorans]SMH67761.1 conserved protein of unknown function [Acidithiobacillus ferrivorans]